MCTLSAHAARGAALTTGSAAQAGDGCDYVIVLQQGEGLYQLDPLPPLPPNARYLKHENKCYDIGTVGWVLKNHVDIK